MSSRPPGSSPIAVVAILADGSSAFDTTLDAVVSQTYEPAGIYIVGHDAEAYAATAGVSGADSIQDLAAGLGPNVTHVWLLRAGAVPRIDALYALLFEAERVSADVAGSKILDADRPDRLVSVGIATDVYMVPNPGLDDGEIDAGQFDVVRDVAGLGGWSTLIRRDLLRGVGGPDPLMDQASAAIDLTQRSRLLGARVVVVPSSEVAVPPTEPAPRWVGEAGRIRTMLTVYSPLTLLWAIPMRILIGLLEAIAAPFAGRWTLFDFLRSWGWNLVRLPSTFRRRRSVQKIAAVGDAELFRYQQSGSVAVRTIVGELGEIAKARFPSADEDGGGVISLAQEIGRPAVGIAAGAVAYAYVATRGLWNGLPGGGMSLPFPASGSDAVTAYAGGWNPAGFGSVEQLPPFVGFAGLWQRIVFDNPDAAAGALVLAAFLAGIWGMTRLLRTWGIEPAVGMIAGIALMGGPAARTLAGAGEVAPLVALGVVPWVMRAAVAPIPEQWQGRLGRVAVVGLFSALLGNVSPDLLAIPAAALALRAVLTAKRSESWRAAAVAASGALLALATMRPFVSNVDWHAYLVVGEAYWRPGLLLAIAVLIAFTAVVVAAPKELWGLGLWGGAMAAVGFLLSRTGATGGGRHLEIFALGAVALGTAVIVGVSFDAVRRISDVSDTSRIVLAIGSLGSAMIIAGALLLVGPGRGGLPADEMRETLRFTGAALEEDTAARVLLVGSPESLPGTSRRVRGAAFRVITAPHPYMWEVELPDPSAADTALAEALEAVIDGESFRVGQQLAEFGIGWVVAMDDSPLASTMFGQLDLIPLDGLRRQAFLVDVDETRLAVADDGSPWTGSFDRFAGDPTASVRVRANAHGGWGTDLEPDDWSMTLDGSAGAVEFDPGPGRRQGQQSLAVVALLAAVGIVARRWS